jgi:hypothetical protein
MGSARGGMPSPALRGRRFRLVQPHSQPPAGDAGICARREKSLTVSRISRRVIRRRGTCRFGGRQIMKPVNSERTASESDLGVSIPMAACPVMRGAGRELMDDRLPGTPLRPCGSRLTFLGDGDGDGDAGRLPGPARHHYGTNAPRSAARRRGPGQQAARPARMPRRGTEIVTGWRAARTSPAASARAGCAGAQHEQGN